MQAEVHTKKYFEKAGVQVENFSLLIISHHCKLVQQLPPS